MIDGNYPMPTHFSEGLQQTIQKCLSVDRRRRIALRVALKDDPWLNDGGRLQDLFLEKKAGYYGGFDMEEPLMIQGVPAELDESVRHRMERERSKRQCLRDMEEEKNAGQQVKRTVIYHPINNAIYFTGNATYSPKMEDNIQVQELLRAELLADMKSVLSQVQLTPISQPPSGHSAIQQFFHKLKRPESILALSSAAYSSNNTSSAYLSSAGGSNSGDSGSADKPNGGGGFSSRLKKTTSTLSLASLYTRPKEHINYYTIQTNLRGSSSATVLSSFSSSSSISGSQSISSPPFPSTATTTTTATTSATIGSVPVSTRTARYSFQPLYDDLSQQQGECELILLVQSACQLLGVTYQHEGRTKLTCVLTLRNYAIDSQQQQQQQQLQKQQSSLHQSSQRRSSRWLQSWRDNDTDDEGGRKQKINKKKSKSGLKSSSSSPNLLRDAGGASSDQQQQQQKQQQYYGGHGSSSTYTSRSSMLDRISNTSSTSRWSRQMRRLSAPFQQWPWSSQSMHLHSSMPIGGPSLTYPANGHASGATTATFGQLKTINPQQQQQTLEIKDDDEDDDDEKGQNRDGIAMFTLEAYSIPNTSKQQPPSSSSGGDGTESCSGNSHVVALRFVKIKGSSKVYKLATGWISGVLSSSAASVSGGTPTSSTMNIV